MGPTAFAVGHLGLSIYDIQYSGDFAENRNRI